MILGSKLKEKCDFTYEWKIKNFSNLSLFDFDLQSPTITSEILDNTKWVFKVKNSEGNLEVNLMCISKLPSTNVQIELFLKKNQLEISDMFDLSKCTSQNRSLILEQYLMFHRPNDIISIGCYVKNNSDRIFDLEKWHAFTDMLERKSSVKFPLIFPFSTSGEEQLIHIPIALDNRKLSDFKIVFNSYFPSIEDLIIHIEMEQKSYHRVYAKWKLSLYDTDENVKYLNEGENWFGQRDKFPIKNCIPKQQKPLNCSKKSIFTLHCKIELTDRPCPSKKEKKICSSSDIDLGQHNLQDCPTMQTFKEKLGRLYAERRLCDFTIQVEGREFPVHKTILGTVSSVFCAMFERDMKEKENSLLMIEDIDADTMQRLIDYAYTEIAADLQRDNAVKLFSAADKYQILELKQKCAEFLSSKLSIENVTDALVLADLHQDSYLKKAAEDFAYSNSNEVLKAEKWKVFMKNHMELANVVMHGICIKMNEKHQN